MTQYNADSIQQLTFREGCRKRIGIYLGEANNNGVINGLLELVNNATDEAIVCERAKLIELEVSKKWASCKDYGRGIPVGKNDYTDEVLINLLTENHSGGKFDDNAYGGKSRGLNGTGSAATCCSSDWFEVTSKRDGFEWFLRFEEGIPCEPKARQVKPLKHLDDTGTYIKYSPSQSVFQAEEINFDYERICELIKEYSYFNKGVKFIVKNVDTGQHKTFLSKNGILDFAEEVIKKPVHKTPIYAKETMGDVDIEIVAQWTKGYERFYLFSNGGENKNGGTPVTGAKTALTRTINNIFKKSFTGDMARTGLVYVISIQLKNPIYSGQTKDSITNPELRGYCDKLFSDSIKLFMKQYPQEAELILDFLEKEDKAEKAAQKARDAIINQTKIIQAAAKKKTILADKLKDCEEHGENSILVLTEGDSALGSMAQARPTKHVALYPLRGKIINALKNNIEDVLDNNEVKDIITLLGAGIFDKYNEKKLRYGKIGIATDGDADGYNIMCLIVTLFSVVMPDFLHQGRLYWLRAPLYRLETAKGPIFAYSENELQALKKAHVVKDVGYIKGLGELTPADTRQAFFGSDERLERFIIKDPATFSQLEMLMGEEVEDRRKFVFEKIDFEKVRD